METRSCSNFELRGEFAGYVRNRAGKRRLLLRTTDHEVRLRIRKELRVQFAELLTAGNRLHVTGVEEIDSLTGRATRRVLHVRGLGSFSTRPAACAACPIRICSKRNCWKNGGEQLWKRLSHKIRAAGLEQTVALKASGCLGNCKHSPNVECRGRLHDGARACDADALLRAIAPRIHPAARY